MGASRPLHNAPSFHITPPPPPTHRERERERENSWNNSELGPSGGEKQQYNWLRGDARRQCYFYVCDNAELQPQGLGLIFVVLLLCADFFMC